MSALFGVWNFDGEDVSETSLELAVRLLREQTSEEQTIYLKDNVGIIHCASMTEKTAYTTPQPHLDASRHVVHWNGRLDNREDLVEALGHPSSFSTADPTIVAQGFEAWGNGLFSRLIGDWSASVWEPVEKKLTLGTDYLGIRHLYYSVEHRRALWSTSLATIIRMSKLPLTINNEYVADFLVTSPAADTTPYLEIKAVPPAHIVTIRHGRATQYRYWNFRPDNRIRYKCDGDYEEHFRHVFRAAVRRRLRSTSPVIAELSGGIDSSSIVCMADQIIQSGEVGSVRLDTISTFDPKEPGGNETSYFSIIEAQRGRTGHHLNREEYGHVFDLNIDRLIVAPGASECRGKLRDDLISLFVAQNYRVLLSGIGGDELLGGVPNPSSQLADFLVLPRPIQLMKQLTAWSLVKKRPAMHLIAEAVASLFPNWLQARLARNSGVAKWIRPEFARGYRLPVRRFRLGGRCGYVQPSRIETAQTVNSLSRQMSRLPTHGMTGEERRYPYLDQSLVEFVLAIPPSQLLRPGQRRSLMRRSLADIVPAEVLWRKTKGFVNRGVLLAFENGLNDLEALFASPVCGALEYVDAVLLRECLARTRHGDASQMMPLLTTLSLELWLRSAVQNGVLAVKTDAKTPRCVPKAHLHFGH